MDKVIEFVKQFLTQNPYSKYILIGIAVILVILVYVIYRSIKLKSLRKKIVDIENNMNAIKSLPLQYRLGRVKSIAINMPEVAQLYDEYSKEYETISDFQKNKLAVLVNEVDEQLFYGKLSKVSKKMKTLSEMLQKYETDSQTLLKKVEKITEIENVQRIEIIKVKEKYRKLIDSYESIRLKVEDYVPNLSKIFDELDESFVSLENLMNHQKFEEAHMFTVKINERIEWVDANIIELPKYVAVVRQYIPKKIDVIDSLIKTMYQENYALDELNVENRMQEINDTYKVMVDKTKAIELDYLSENLEEYVNVIDALNSELEEEVSANNAFKQKWEECNNIVADLYKRYKNTLIDFNKIKTLYIIDDLDIDIDERYEEFEVILKESYDLENIIQKNHFSYTQMNEKVDALKQKTIVHEEYLTNFVQVRDELYIAEQRAINELENINIVLLEIKSEIKNKHLPMINESYKDYIQDSYDKAAQIQAYRQNRPVELNTLSKKVDDARDVIYKLYDNVHNLVVTAEMVEEAIVYGNRYRSIFLEVNTELTKAEVLFRNGEYTKALTTAVDIIEKIKPGCYEELIKKSIKKSA